jgi:predicted  nucleic acid-binding Zn-ribbon protein
MAETEVEVGGIKFKGGRIFIVLTALSSAGGALWGGFEFWKDYQNLVATVQNYTAPDLSGFDKQLAVMAKEMGGVSRQMASVRLRVAEIQQLTRGLRDDVRSDTAKTYKAISAVDRRSRSADADTRAAMRQAEKLMRAIIASSSDRLDAKVNSAASTFDAKTSSAVTRFDAKINGIESRLTAHTQKLDRRLRDALDNPLLRK